MQNTTCDSLCQFYCECSLWFSYVQHNTSCRRHHHAISQIHDDSTFQTTFRIPATHTHSTAVRYSDREWGCSLPAAPPACGSSHHWYRHRHRTSNERLALRRVTDWLNLTDDNDATVPPTGELERHHDMILVHEHRCRRYYLYS